MNITQYLPPFLRPATREAAAQDSPKLGADNGRNPRQPVGSQDIDTAQLSKEASETTNVPTQPVPDFTKSMEPKKAPQPFVPREP